MRAYQFVFYTFYYIFETVSRDKQSVWKAEVVMCVIQVWIIFIILSTAHLIEMIYQQSKVLPLVGVLVWAAAGSADTGSSYMRSDVSWLPVTQVRHRMGNACGNDGVTTTSCHKRCRDKSELQRVAL